MARNDFSGEGANLGVSFLRVPIGASWEHHVRGDYAAGLFNGFIGRHGIVSGFGDELACSVNASRVVTIETGEAWINAKTAYDSEGVAYSIKVYADALHTRTLGTPHATLARVDAIVLRTNLATSTTDITVVAGSPGQGRAGVTLQANDVVLRYFTVPAMGAGDATGDEYLATRFFQPQAPTTETGGATLSTADIRRTIQSPRSDGWLAINNSRGLTRDATKRWVVMPPSAGNNFVLQLQEEEDTGYGFGRNSVADRTFGDGRILFVFGYWDADNGNQWIVAVLYHDDDYIARGHIVESTTASRVTTEGNATSLPNPGGTMPDGVTMFPLDTVGIQSGDAVRVVSGTGASSTVMMFDIAIVSTATSLSLVFGTAQASHSARARWTLAFAAPAASDGYLLALHSDADLDFHDEDANGTIERFNAMGVKQTGSFNAPIGNVLAHSFNVARQAGIREETNLNTGWAGIDSTTAAQIRQLLNNVPAATDDTANEIMQVELIDNDVDAVSGSAVFTRAEFDGLESLGGINTNTNGPRTTFTNRSFRISGEVYVGKSSANSMATVVFRNDLIGSGTYETASLRRRDVALPLWGLTRINDVLCFESPTLIFPVQDASDAAGFWPFVGAGQ